MSRVVDRLRGFGQKVERSGDVVRLPIPGGWLIIRIYREELTLTELVGPSMHRDWIPLPRQGLSATGVARIIDGVVRGRILELRVPEQLRAIERCRYLESRAREASGKGGQPETEWGPGLLYRRDAVLSQHDIDLDDVKDS